MAGVSTQPIVKYLENHPYNTTMGIPKQNKEATAFLLLRSTMSKRKGKLKVIPKDNSHGPGIDMKQSDGG